MPISSMTGFARSEGLHDGVGWTWEVKSVNARNLDMRFRLPNGHDQLEMSGRGAVARRLKRGNVSIALTLTRSARPAQVRINHDVLQQMVALAETLHQRTGTPPRPDGLLALKGVVEQVEEDETAEAREARFAEMAASLERALDGLATAREEEGARIAGAIGSHLAEIDRLTAEAGATAAAQPEAVKTRLSQQLADLLGPDAPVSSDRLEQEIALLAARADVREEIDRLKSHVVAAHDLLAAGGALGRQLDFLCQEFNREANTLCSKSADKELTRVGLELKTAIDRLREQVQNLE